MQVSVYLRDSVRATDRSFDYRIPDHLVGQVLVGQYVEVPFGAGNRPETAVVAAISEDVESEYTLKFISRILDPIPVLKEDQFRLLPFLRMRYSCTYGDAIRLMVPSLASARADSGRQTAILSDPEEAVAALECGAIDSLLQVRILELLLECEEASVSEIMSALSVSRSPIDTLRKKGLIHIVKRNPKAAESPASNLPDEAQVPFVLSSSQKDAAEKILHATPGQEFLLYGVTGSGKTEVYLQAAAKILEEEGTILFLVPEISLTPQMISWITARFPGMTAVLHSRLTPKERYEQWNRIRTGKARVVVGARSSIFAPLPNLRLILIDEEQDSSYKSETHPRYHVRDVARYRAKVLGATLVLGSATPSVETFYAAEKGYTQMIRLPERVGKALIPRTCIVDMREELRHRNRSVFSRALRDAMTEAFEKKEQVILFLNKRGYSSMVLCRSCGQAVTCPHCSVAMTLHTMKRSARPSLICHYCGQILPVPEECPSCGSTVQGKFGIGTQQLEELVRHEFPGIIPIRMDQDTTSGKDAHERILRLFREGEASVLIGTQMIAKGHDFPNVTVVGILSADMLIRASDFRAGERAFQLITQASGRAGRGEKPGLVFVQTYQPDDDIVLAAASQNYEAFYRNEIEYRRRLGYPPFRALGSILVSMPSESETNTTAEKVRAILETCVDRYPGHGFEIYGPIPAPLYKVRDRYRSRMNLKADKKASLSAIFNALQAECDRIGIPISLDIDPLW